MKKLIIEGGRELSGTLEISGAKNSIVALLPASMLTEGKCVITNVPDISDVRNLIEIMKKLGSKITFKDETITIDNKNVKNTPIPEAYASKLRASYYFMGALVGKFQHAEIAYPGGCIIGSRPMDFHIDAFKKMGAKVVESYGSYIIDGKKLNGTEIFFDFPSVGATINVMLLATLTKGKTIIRNAAKEPEIINVASFLNSMGARIFGAGTSTIEITGVEALGDGFVETIPDRIEAGTYLILGALIGNNLKIEHVCKENIASLLFKLKEAGVKYKINKDTITISKAKKLTSINVKTSVYPGFPTDLGQPMSTFLTQCEGESIFEETIYENRLRHVPYLNLMGANINAIDKKAIINGKTKLNGKFVRATDLRAGASMLVAGMIANGTTTITNVEHLLRGYEKIVEKLARVGAKIQLIDD